MLTSSAQLQTTRFVPTQIQTIRTQIRLIRTQPEVHSFAPNLDSILVILKVNTVHRFIVHFVWVRITWVRNDRGYETTGRLVVRTGPDRLRNVQT